MPNELGEEFAGEEPIKGLFLVGIFAIPWSGAGLFVFTVGVKRDARDVGIREAAQS